ncbi:MAG: hypothetical protein J5I90_14415 [Caldilineales bacterium]|nr:hypothetical protein [Caldilineales bacterium]
MATPNEIDLQVSIVASDLDAQQLDEMTSYLQRDLRELGVDAVERAQGGDSVPARAKGDPFTLGALALVVAPVILPKVLEFLQAWVLRAEQRKIRIKTPDGLEIEFTPANRLTQAEVIALAKELTKTEG